VLLSGSGPNARDYEISGHKFFLVLADHLTRHGIAVLRYDTRGTGSSQGAFASAKFSDHVQDAAAALRFLKQRPDVATKHTGVLAHSTGTLLSLHLGEHVEGPSFLGLLMPPSYALNEALLAQNVRLWKAWNASPAQVDSVQALLEGVFKAASVAPDSATAAAQIRASAQRQGVSGAPLASLIQAHTSPFFMDLARYNPQPALRQVDIPVLVVFGSKDLLVAPQDHEEPLLSALAQSQSDDATIRVLEGINHWFQPAETGLRDEISTIETTMAPEVLDLLIEWLRAHASVGE
jgi:pimeloyl-ACP methyl ester carboxylesterase